MKLDIPRISPDSFSFLSTELHDLISTFPPALIIARAYFFTYSSDFFFSTEDEKEVKELTKKLETFKPVTKVKEEKKEDEEKIIHVYALVRKRPERIKIQGIDRLWLLIGHI